jgi:hypothetical protein
MGNTGFDKRRLSPIKEPQWISLVSDFFVAWSNRDIFYCDIGIRSKEGINTGLKVYFEIIILFIRVFEKSHLLASEAKMGLKT